ncbi:methyl-accepting chemotaxis protein [Xanthobacter sp. V4C-4]|uniref:methyl-accepting chemotaxis protein n=1 Tax=Xanthobacter cornucopiae TaxID=3119924 RepID=UPI0037263DA3
MSAVSNSSRLSSASDQPRMELVMDIGGARAHLEPDTVAQVEEMIQKLFQAPAKELVAPLLDAGVAADVLLQALDCVVEHTCARLSRQMFMLGRSAALADIAHRYAMAAAAVQCAAAVRQVTAQMTSQALGRNMANLKNLADTVSDVNDVALEIAYLSRNTQRATEGAQSVASAVAELVSSVEEISRSSDETLRDAQRASAASSHATSAVANLRETTVAITESTDDTRQRARELVGAFDQIADVLRVIDTISKQTNLLALNATIEAARAGEAGKGFAIVAQEVKALANQTGGAAEEIGRRVEGMRLVISRMGDTLARSEEAVGASAQAIEQVSAAVGAIDGAVTTVAERMEVIASVLAQQKIASEEIGARVTQSADLSTENQHLLMRIATSLQNGNDRFTSTAREWFDAKSPEALCEMAKIDHVLFKKRVVDVLMNRTTWESKAVPDHHHCRLGQWYDSIDTPEVRAIPAFTALTEPHRRVHAAAHQVLKLSEENRRDEAMDALVTLDKESREVLRILDELALGLQEQRRAREAAPARLQ